MAKVKKTASQTVPLPGNPSPLPPYEVETWTVDRLKPYERNARKHGSAQVAQLRGSFQKFGQVWPILVREDGTIIAGHGRLDAAVAEGFADVRVIVARGWSEEQCRAFGILDNKLALNSEWDEEALGLELAELSQLGVPLADLGFAELELGALMTGGELAETATEKKERSGDLSPVIQFNIVFDDERQQEQWFAFVRQLKSRFPEQETLGSRLSIFLAEQTSAAG